MRDIKTAPLVFESMSEKLATIKAFNDLLRAAGKPAVHEGLEQTDPLFSVYLCIYETPAENPAPKITVRTLETCARNNANENGVGVHRYSGPNGFSLWVRYQEGGDPDFQWAVCKSSMGERTPIGEDEAARYLEEWQS